MGLTAPKSILFLVSDPMETDNDNQRLLPAAFARANWRVAVAAHDSLAWLEGEVTCSQGPISGYTKIWLLGFGPRTTFFDRMQLLAQRPKAQFVNTPEALLLWHGKLQGLQYNPETHASRDLEQLIKFVIDEQTWIVKPTARSHGDGVSIVRGPVEARAALTKLLDLGEYAMLQRYIPSIEQGELRLIFAAGSCVAAYRRLPNAAGLTNMTQGAVAAPHAPTAEDLALAEPLAQLLHTHGASYCSIDIAHPYVIESNVANAGGLGTLAALDATQSPSAAEQVVACLIRSWEPKD